MVNRPELDAAVLSNPEARATYYEQRRLNTAAREQQVKETATINLLAGIVEFEIVKATQKPMEPEEIENLRARIKIALQRSVK